MLLKLDPMPSEARISDLGIYGPSDDAAIFHARVRMECCYALPYVLTRIQTTAFS